MAQIADLVAFDPDGQITLIVEVNSRIDTSRPWATRMRRNILAHGTVPNTRFQLLALPDRLYLWKDAGNAPELVEPTYEIDATPLFRPYLERAKIPPDQLTGQTLVLIVTSWLNDLIQSGLAAGLPDRQRVLLQESGLVEALKGGSVAVEVPA